jgi:hypothetical protein
MNAFEPSRGYERAMSRIVGVLLNARAELDCAEYFFDLSWNVLCRTMITRHGPFQTSWPSHMLQRRRFQRLSLLL